ncbi:hypothetical protein [Halosolutus halophilus]|uniref:hypothetical protein n=1 Tax=Halosolutus halophilus TaxID=1552990 RepID=UPI002235035E|nr:hypothetical protein [Halosolutus halophilus]
MITASGAVLPEDDQTVVYTLDDERCDVSEHLNETVDYTNDLEESESESESGRDRNDNDHRESERDRDVSERDSQRDLNESERDSRHDRDYDRDGSESEVNATKASAHTISRPVIALGATATPRARANAPRTNTNRRTASRPLTPIARRSPSG